jgi:hypothetical protein
MSSEIWLLALALVIGPSLGVAFAFLWQARERAHARKLDLFHTMMRTRRLWLSQEWIGALCLVPVEFRKYPMVIDATNGLLDKFGDPAWRGVEQQRQRVVLDTEASVCAVLQHMADALKIELKAADLRARTLAPLGWVVDDVHVRHTRERLMQVLEGQRALRVEMVETRAPPAPAPTTAAPAPAATQPAEAPV